LERACERTPEGEWRRAVGRAATALTSIASVKLKALRGAITVEDNEAEAILGATEELLRELLDRNGLGPDDLVSCLFTCTEDLDAAFPAEAARRLGLNAVPLLCAREIDVPGALPRVIRLLVHCYTDGEAQHVYLREAETLRRDLQGAQ
jgi:chorismate mutase